jgi:hypothetical protein
MRTHNSRTHVPVKAAAGPHQGRETMDGREERERQ